MEINKIELPNYNKDYKNFNIIDYNNKFYESLNNIYYYDIILTVVFLLFYFIFICIILQESWNYVMPYIFSSLPQLTIYHAIALLLVSRIIFRFPIFY